MAAAAGASIPAQSGWVGSNTARPCSGDAVHRRAERLGQRDQRRLGAGGGHLVAGHDGHPADRRPVSRSASSSSPPAAASSTIVERGRRADLGGADPTARAGPCASTRTPGPAGALAASANARRRIGAELAEAAHLVGPLARRRGEVGERAREQRVGDEVALVLLAGGHDERGAVGPGVGEVADGVAEPGRGVQVEERRPAGGLGVAVGHARRRRLLEGEHVVEVVDVGEGVDQRQLGRPGVAEDVADALGAQHLEQDLAARSTSVGAFLDGHSDARAARGSSTATAGQRRRARARSGRTEPWSSRRASGADTSEAGDAGRARRRRWRRGCSVAELAGDGERRRRTRARRRGRTGPSVARRVGPSARW